MSARLSVHARQRAAEMAIPTKAIKRLADGRTPGVDYPAAIGRLHRRGPDFTLVLDHDEDGQRWVVTVLWNCEFDRRTRRATPGGNLEAPTTPPRR